MEMDVGGADMGGGEEGEKGDAVGDGFDADPAALFAVDEAEDAGDVHAGVAGGFDGGDRGSAGGADVVKDDDRGAGLEEAFDAAACAVGLFGFADEESVEELGCFGIGIGIEAEVGGDFEGFGVVGGGPGAGGGGVGDEGVCAHGEAAHGDGGGDVLADEFVEEEAGEAAALGVQCGDAAVDVVVGPLAGGEGEVAKAEGVGSKEMEEAGAEVRGGGAFSDGH